MHISTWLSFGFLLPTVTSAFYLLPDQDLDSKEASERGSNDRRFFTWLGEDGLDSPAGGVLSLSIKKGPSPKAGNHPNSVETLY